MAVSTAMEPFTGGFGTMFSVEKWMWVAEVPQSVMVAVPVSGSGSAWNNTRELQNWPL